MVIYKLKTGRFCNLLVVTEGTSFQFFTQSVSLYYLSNVYPSHFTYVIHGELLLAITIYHRLNEILCALVWEWTVCWSSTEQVGSVTTCI